MGSSRTPAALSHAAVVLLLPVVVANFSPASRVLNPVGILEGRNKGVTHHSSSSVFPLTLAGDNAFVVLDFGKEVGGITTVQWGSVVQGSASVGLAYSESSNFAACPALTLCDHPSAPCACQFGPTNQSGAGDHSNGGKGPDLTLSSGAVRPHTNYTPSIAHMRGGFRYLNLFLESGGSVEVAGVSLYFTAAPTMENPANYRNHFNSSDELINKVWYGCAYTTQMCSISPSHGRDWPAPPVGWNNGVLIGAGDTLLVDGAKRDRTIWPGDMGVSVGTALVTTGDVNSSINSLQTLFELQDSVSGMLPYVGPAVFCEKPYGQECASSHRYNSDMYHLWALVGASNIFLHTSDRSWLRTVWANYVKGVGASLAKVHKLSGLMVVDAAADWARKGQGGSNIAANSLLVHVLDRSATLATAMSDGSAAAKYSTQAAALRKAINKHLWDEAGGAFKDNPTSRVLPQDGNSLALWFQIASTPERAAHISKYLKGNWGEFGASSPEWGDDIGTFPGSMEVLAHAASGDATAALDLIRLQWGYMLKHPNGTQSTFWEGYHKDGSWAYQTIYMSHAHGWATGPAAALTHHVLGIQPAVAWNEGGHETYHIKPSPAGLAFCDGSLAWSDGRVQVSWTTDATGWITMDLSTNEAPTHSTARVGLPLPPGVVRGSTVEVLVDGVLLTGNNNDGIALDESDAEGRIWLTLTERRSLTLALVAKAP